MPMMPTVFVAALAAALGGVETRELPLKPPRNGGVYVVAHRGAHQGIPENTLAAYRKAIELGCDFVEIDVRTTKDGRFVSVHNSTVDGYVDGVTGRVDEFTLAELKALDIGSRVGPEWKDERIPTFEEILDLCNGKIGIYLDLKEAPVEPLVREIEKRNMQHSVIWYAGSRELKQVKALSPECVIMPDPGPEKNLPPLLKDLEPRVVATVWRHHTKSLVEMCHEAGAIVIVDEGDVDPKRDVTCWQQALAWHSDGVQTDYPAEFIAFLKAREKAAAATPAEGSSIE